MIKKIDFAQLNLRELNENEEMSIDGGGLGKKIGHAIGWFAGQVVNGVEWWRENFKQPPELIGVK